MRLSSQRRLKKLKLVEKIVGGEKLGKGFDS